MSVNNSQTQQHYYKVRNVVDREERHIPANEIRVTGRSTASRIIGRARFLFKDKEQDTIILKGVGNAIPTLCVATEIIRRRIKGLHQQSILQTIVVKDQFSPKEEGLDDVVIERKLTVLEVTLTTQVNKVDTNHYGYQQPLAEKEVIEFDSEELKRQEESKQQRGGRGGRRGGFFRGGRGGLRVRTDGRGGRGRGRGRGRPYQSNYDNYDNYERSGSRSPGSGERRFRGSRRGDRRGGNRFNGRRGGRRGGRYATSPGYRGGSRSPGYEGQQRNDYRGRSRSPGSRGGRRGRGDGGFRQRGNDRSPYGQRQGSKSPRQQSRDPQQNRQRGNHSPGRRGERRGGRRGGRD